MGNILVVDDERSLREFLAICLKRAGHQVTVAEAGMAALQILEASTFDVVVTDLRMPGELDGLGLLGEIKARQIESEVIVMTAFATAQTAIDALKQGAYDYLTKPFKVDDITAVISRAVEKRALVSDNRTLREQVSKKYRLASLIGKSDQMQRVFRLIEKLATTKTNALITGESGTGKELVALALHSEGERSGAAFVAVNCGAIPEELLESELFGHVRGAFTGAVADKEGLFRQAHGGTLFLDEIGELAPSLQVKLLRALQERVVKPVGGSKEVSIDVRLIAATNRDLEEEVKRGAFRSDLFYRLNVIEIRLPPLRQRIVDVPLLAEHFLRNFSVEQGKRVSGFSPDALKALEQHDFPGNVRELQNVVERAVTLCSGETITAADLPTFTERRRGTTDGAELDFPDEGIDLDRVVADYERKIIERALVHAKGVRKRAAAVLGVSIRSLRYRLEKLGFDSDESKS